MQATYPELVEGSYSKKWNHTEPLFVLQKVRESFMPLNNVKAVSHKKLCSQLNPNREASLESHYFDFIIYKNKFCGLLFTSLARDFYL